MKFGRRIKRTTKQYIIVALICILVIGTAAIATSVIMIGQIREEYEFVLSDLRQEMSDNRRYVYITLHDIRSGEVLSIDKVEKKLVYTSEPAHSYVTEDELGKAAMIDIPKGSSIVKGMLAKNTVSPILREVEYDVIYVSSNIEVNDYVDIRIFFPNGESYVVLSKKSLKGFQPNTPICYLWVDEEELLRMSAAIVDAGLYSGSRLYMTKYIEPNIQDPSVITYTPSVSVLSLIQNDPNIINRCSQVLNKEVRKALENRLANSMGIDISAINWELDSAIRYMPDMTDEPILDNVEDTVDIEDIREEEHDIRDIYEPGNNDEIDHVNHEDSEASIYFPELGRSGEEECYMATEG